MALILNIETSTEVCSVSLARNGNLIGFRESSEGFNHSKLLTVFIEELFKEVNLNIKLLDAVAVSKGPGSYTGLRIGVSVAKGLCYGLEIPLISDCSLESMALYTAFNPEKYVPVKSSLPLLFCPMIDARRMEVYTALYNSEGKEIKPVTAEIIDENFLSELFNNHLIFFFGNGAEKCKSSINHKNAIFAGPTETSAQFMQAISEEKYKKQEFEDVAYFEPFYLKNFVATIPKDKILK